MPYRPPSHILYALVSERPHLVNLVTSAVDTSFRMAHAQLFSRVGEVEKLIFFFTQGLPILEFGMNRLLGPHGVYVTISGIFCHQTPKVKEVAPTASSTSCELGDIAFLSVYGEPLGPSLNGLGNGTLMQAKEHFHPGVSSLQERLYQDVEQFAYTSPRSLSPQQRSLLTAHACLYYWSFTHWRSSYDTETILARPWPVTPGYSSEPFGQTLVNLFSGAAGRGFQAQPAGDGWSRIVHDLIQNSATRSLRHRRIFSPRQPRPRRIYNYSALIPRTGSAPSIVRCSLAEFLEHFGPEAAEAGRTLENESREYQLPEGNDAEPPGGDKNPPLDRGGEGDDEGGGGSFVVFQFSKVEPTC